MSKVATLLLVFLTATIGLHAQTLVESFTGTSVSGNWTLSGSGYTPILTAASGLDPNGSGWLRLTNTNTNLATYAVNNTAFQSANATVYASFDYISWGGSGADGITFFLFDGSKTFSPGAYGGSLGYAQRTGVAGMNGGYLGIGLDEFGNYSNPTEGRSGGAGFIADSIAVRGPQNTTDPTRMTGYSYLGGSSSLTPGIDIANTNGATTRPSITGANYRHVELTLSPTNQLTVSLTSGYGNAPSTVLTMDLSQYARPDTLKLGFTASSGDLTNYHEVRNVTESSIEAFKWKNLAGNSLWSGTTNWANSKVPTASSDIFLDNQFVTGAQNIQVDMAPTVRSIYFDGPYAYNLSGNTITFDKAAAPGESLIAVSATSGTAASHTIGSNVQLNNNVRLSNPTSATLNITGNVNLQGYQLKTEGLSSISGNISGNGTLVNTGTLSLSGNNTFSGGANISGSTYITSNTAFGTGALQLSGNLTGYNVTPNTTIIGNATTFTGNTTVNNVSFSNTSTFSGSHTLYLSNVTSLGAIALSNSTTANTVTINNVGTTTVGSISSGSASTGNLIKSGSGMIVLGAASTYTGTTTINDGIVKYGVNNALSTSSNLVMAGGTIDLSGYNTQLNDFRVTQNSVLDFGAAGGTNDFLFNTMNNSPSGVLTLNNYNSNNAFAVLNSNRNTTGITSLLSSVYFSGVGAGGVLSGSTTSLNGFTWRQILPATNTGRVWISNSSQTWATTNNWAGGNVPNNNTEVAVFDGTGTQASVNLAAANTVLGVRFDTNSTVSYNINGTSTLSFDSGLTGGIAYVQQKSPTLQQISTPVYIMNNTVLDVTGTGNLVMSGVMTSSNGTNTLTKAGAGTLELRGASTGLNNNVFLTDGSTIINNNNSLGSGANTTYVNNGATLNANAATGITVTEKLRLDGAGDNNQGALVSTSGTNTFSGTIGLDNTASINVTAGTLNLSGVLTSGNYALTSTVGSGALLNLSNANNTLGVVNKYGAGEMRLGSSGATTLNAYAGTSKFGGTLTDLNGLGGDVSLTAAATVTNVNMTGGTLTLGGYALSTTSFDTSSGSTVNTTGGLTISGTGSSTIAGNLTGSGTLANSSNGRVYLTGNNSSYTGNMTSYGVITANSSNSLGTGNLTTYNGGTLELQGNMTATNAISTVGVGYGSGAINNLSGTNTLSGTVTLSGGATVNTASGALTMSNVAIGANALTVSGGGNTTINSFSSTTAATLNKMGSGTLSLNGTGFGGAMSVTGGTVIAGANGMFAGSATLALASGGTLDLNGKSLSLTSISGSGGSIFMDAGTLSLSGASTFGGTFTGSGTLTLAANASLTLTGGFSDSNLNLTLNTGSKLYLNGQNLTLGDLKISGTSTIDFGSSASSLTINGVTFDTTGLQLQVSQWTNLQDYFFSLTSTGAKGTAPTNQIVFSGYNGNNTSWVPYDAQKGQFTPVPEPQVTGAIMSGMTVMAYGLISWKRRTKAKKS